VVVSLLVLVEVENSEVAAAGVSEDVIGLC
jgi:hypothetical protein